MAIAISPQTTWFSGGVNAAGGSLYVYQTGTTTLVTIYSDGGLTTPITNPIVLDANGNAVFYVGTSTALKLQAYTSVGVLIETLDPVYPISTTSIGYIQKTVQSTGTTYTVSPTDISSGTLFYPTSGSGAFTYTIPQSALTSNTGYFGFCNLANTGGVTLSFTGGAICTGWGVLNGVTSISMPSDATNGPPQIIFFSDGSGNVRVIEVTPDIQALQTTAAVLNPNPLTSSISNNISMSVIGTYYDGPSVSQGNTGTFFTSGKVTFNSVTIGSGTNFNVKLWDGTTVIDSVASGTSENAFFSVSLSGFLTNPAGNIKISATNTGATNGTMIANTSGNGKDSTITVFRLK